jgi:GTP cyclohydrolase II
MTDKRKDSKNTADALQRAIISLRRQEGVIVTQKNGKQVAVYPAEFLDESAQSKYKTVKSSTITTIAKRAGLLPTLLVIPIGKATAGWAVFLEKELEKALKETGGKIFETTRAKLPIDGAENSTIVSFREQDEGTVHLALIIGKPKNSELPLVRVHSSCVTGDLLGSLRCDCGDQLKLALTAIKKEGYGVLLYLNQEGRGIGITNKLRAYKLQEQGMDTYAANHALGFADDERDFTVAGSILKSLGISKINLLSNNPHKVAEIRKQGITVSKRVALIAKPSKHNRAYITAKSQKAGHIMGMNIGENE